MDTRTMRDANRRGQAAVEFVIAIIALLLIVTGGVYLIHLNTAQRDMAETLRGKVGVAALQEGIIVSSEPVDYIRGWNVGDDGRPETADDKPDMGSALVLNTIADHGTAREAADWDRVEDLFTRYQSDKKRFQPFLVLHRNPMSMSNFEFVHFSDEREVDVEPFLLNFITDKDSVMVRHGVVLPSCSNLY
ncbi:MAG: hypothetical protein FWF96_04290 [Kiritimatiellaeota bacterium]|nr:hypothetical protein [Kiritimatiellota bacterium]